MSLRSIGGIDLWVEEGGTPGGPTLLLMHGLSGTGRIWDGIRPLIDQHWPGRWIIPDMRGHGRSDHSKRYSIAGHAADMVELVGDQSDLYLAGHSMGGLVGILMASGWFGVSPKAVVTVGVKVIWTKEERSAIDKLVDMPIRWFKTEKEARERFVLVTGLEDLADPTSEFAGSGVVKEDGKWRLAADTRAAMVADADTHDMYRAARSPIVLAAGECDSMASVYDLRTLDPSARELAGLGHNAHAENPLAFWNLIAETAGLAT